MKMSKRKKIDLQSENVKISFANVFSIIIDFIRPKILALVLGRGTGKTSDILAKRTRAVSCDMPGCYIALSSDTYMNAMSNVLPALLEGFERMGWVENIHYVVGKRPPKHFKKPYKPPQVWKHTLTIFTGAHIKIISLDRPSTGAGDSYQHHLGDEVKFQPEKKVNKLTPAIRGEFARFGKSVYYRGKTFTTDMPNPNHREHDWIKRLKKNMNPKQIKLILQTAFVLNDIRTEIHIAKDNGDSKALIKLLEKKLQRWEERYNKVRKNSTFYYEGSSYINADILTEGYFQDLLDTMLFGEFKTSILSIEPTLEKGQMFYSNLGTKNFYSDSWNYSKADKTILSTTAYQPNSLDLKYIQHHQPIEIGLDTGKMCSLALGQPYGKDIYRVFGFIHTLPPEFLTDLGEKFRDFFKDHQCKEVIAYHDRGANQYESVGDDHASKFKKAIEFTKEGNPTGWVVTLMNRGQATISQQTEYELVNAMCLGLHGLPLLMIDQNVAKPIKSSMEKAVIIIKTDKHGNKTVHKNKTSESLPNDRLLMESTNPSDSLKYLLCRPENLEKIQGEAATRFITDPGSH